MGNLTQRQDLITPETETFGYDFLDRLTTVSGAYSQSYNYNEIGNLTSMTTDGTTRNYSYESSRPHAVTTISNPTTSYIYDNSGTGNGNLTTRGDQTIAWDVENRPVSISSSGTPSLTRYEWSHDSADSSDANDTVWIAQTFTPASSHTVKQIKLSLQRVGSSPSGDFIVSIRDTSSGAPSGNDLASDSMLAASINTGSYSTYTFDLGSGISLEADHMYAIVFRAPGMSGSNTVYYQLNSASGGTYKTPGDTANCQFASTDSGSSWFAHNSWDIWFEEWGTTGSSSISFVYDGDGNRVKKTDNGVTTVYVNQYYEKTGSEVTTHYYLGNKEIAQRKDTTLSYIHQDSPSNSSLVTNASSMNRYFSSVIL